MGANSDSLFELSFETTVIYWRGPSPFFYAPIPPQHVDDLRRVSKAVTYGWGMVPVEATIGGVFFKTALFPKDATYLLPLKDTVRRKANITAGDVIDVDIVIRPPARPRHGSPV
jgi:hypothetical protein